MTAETPKTAWMGRASLPPVLAAAFLVFVAVDPERSNPSRPALLGLAALLGGLSVLLALAGLRGRGRGAAALGLLLCLLTGGEYIFLRGVEQVRTAASVMLSLNNLKMIGLAMRGYADRHDRTLPPAAVYDGQGRPLLSWRVLLLPYLENDHLYRKFRLDEPWDGPHNRLLLAEMPMVFAPPEEVAEAPPGTTYYQVFVGEGAAFEGAVGVRLRDLTDGQEHTILVVEGGEPVPWTKPAELPFVAETLALPKLGGLFRGDFHAVLADGSARRIPGDVSEATLRAIVTRAAGDRPRVEW